MKKFLPILFAFIIFTLGCAPHIQDKVARVNDGDFDTTFDITTSEVSYMDGREDVVGYLAKPVGVEEAPGIILIHEWWGLNDNIRQNTEKFAQEGYVALAVDLYAGENAGRDPAKARELATKVRGDMDGAFANLNAAMAYIQTQKEVDGERLASIGWCFGGGWSYEIAKNNLGAKASVIYYGRFNPEDDLEQMRTKIIGHFGEDDASIKVSDVKQFQATLQTQSGDHEVYIYPNSGHGFANEDNDVYNQESAETAWKRTLKFLEEHL